jgi:hypothetical protein
MWRVAMERFLILLRWSWRNALSLGQSLICSSDVRRLRPHSETGCPCGLMVTENGVTRCGRLGKRCDGIAVWSAFLNGERECKLWP